MFKKLQHALDPEQKRSGQTAIKAPRFCIKLLSFKTSMLQFLKKTKFNNLLSEFRKSVERLWSTSKKPIFYQLPIDILLGRTSHEGIWGCPLNLSPHNCRLFLNRVIQIWRLKSTGQVSPVQFSCTEKLLMKLEVNQCYHAFQKDFAF